MPRRTVLSILAVASAILVIGWTAPVAQGQSHPRFSAAANHDTATPNTATPNTGTPDTSRAARADAIRHIPLGRLTPQAQGRIRRIVDSPTLFRRLPTQRMECDPEMFVFLVRHPEVMVGIWEEMGITQVKTQRTAPFQLQANDHAGTQCDIDLVYGDQNTHLYYATGDYSGPLAAVPVSGKGVFLLRSQTVQTPDGQSLVVGTLDCFIQLDNLGADLLARTLSGLIGRTADNNFEESAKFMAQISRASAQNPQGMEDLAGRLPQVLPEIRQRFAEKARTVYENQHRTAALTSENR